VTTFRENYDRRTRSNAYSRTLRIFEEGKSAMRTTAAGKVCFCTPVSRCFFVENWEIFLCNECERERERDKRKGEGNEREVWLPSQTLEKQGFQECWVARGKREGREGNVTWLVRLQVQKRIEFEGILPLVSLTINILFLSTSIYHHQLFFLSHKCWIRINCG
jgi:hypothetical protein